MLSPFSKIRVYHGTNLFSAMLIKQYGIRLTVQRKTTDFGKGFYVTPTINQAIQWAKEKSKNPPINKKIVKLMAMSDAEYEHHPYTKIPALIQFDLNMFQLLLLHGLIFPLPDNPLWNP